jgi:hypothetical protein
MKKGLIITLTVIGIFVITSITLFNTYRSTYDRNVELKNQFKAQKNVIAGNFDKMWKVLRDKGNVTENAAKAFKDIYVPMIEGRYSKGDGSLMKWVTEQNPQFDQSLYKDLSNSIEALRSEFETEQKKILAIKEQHDNLRQRFWSHMFLGDEPELEYQMITSTVTQEVVKTGKDDMDLFGKDSSK